MRHRGVLSLGVYRRKTCHRIEDGDALTVGLGRTRAPIERAAEVRTAAVTTATLKIMPDEERLQARFRGARPGDEGPRRIGVGRGIVAAEGWSTAGVRKRTGRWILAGAFVAMGIAGNGRAFMDVPAFLRFFRCSSRRKRVRPLANPLEPAPDHG